MKIHKKIIVMCSLLCAIKCAAGNYYVNTNGSDSANGSFAAPWLTIQHAVNNVSAGDTVYARSGLYSEQVTFSNSGSAVSGHITLKNYANENPIIDGTSLTVSDGKDALLALNSQDFIIVDGFELRNFKTAEESHVPIGVLITDDSTDVTLRNLKIHDIEANYDPGGDAVLGADAHGIAVYADNASAPVTNLTISNVEIYDCKLGSSEALTLNGNVSGFVVSNCEVHDNNNIGIVFIGHESTCSDPAKDQARNGICEKNISYNINTTGNPAYRNGANYDRSAGGIYVDGGKNIIIDRNTVHDCDIGIEVASEWPGKYTSHITVRNNFIYRNYTGGIFLGGYDNTRGNAQYCTFIGNTLYHNDTGKDYSGEIILQYHVMDCIFENNIIVALANDGGDAVFTGGPGGSGSTPTSTAFDYNWYFSDESSSPAWTWGNNEYYSFANWQGVGHETNGTYNIDPLLIDPGNGNLHLRTTSPVRNKGHNRSDCGTSDIDGDVRTAHGRIDIGADEAFVNGRLPDISSSNTFLQYYGNDFSNTNLAAMAEFDVVVLHPSNATNMQPRHVSYLQTNGVKYVIGYISIGEEGALANRLTGDGSGPVYMDETTHELVYQNNGVASFYVDAIWDASNSVYIHDGILDTNGAFGSVFIYPNSEWRMLLNTQNITSVRGRAGLQQLLQTRTSDDDTSRANNFGLDGVFLDTLDTAGPWNAWGYYPWVAEPMRNTVKFISTNYPSSIVFANRGTFFHNPNYYNPTYQLKPYNYTTRPYIDAQLFESYYLDSDPAHGVSPYFDENRHNIAPKIGAEANRSDGFTVFCLDYMVDRGSIYYSNQINYAVVEQGWADYLSTDGAIENVQTYVKYHMPPADNSPPVWDSTAGTGTNDPANRIGIQSIQKGSGDRRVIINWDAARDQTPPILYNIYQSSDSNFSASVTIHSNIQYNVGDNYADSTIDHFANRTVITNLPTGTTCYFRVRAQDSTASAYEDTNTTTLSITFTGDFPDASTNFTCPQSLFPGTEFIITNQYSDANGYTNLNILYLSLTNPLSSSLVFTAQVSGVTGVGTNPSATGIRSLSYAYTASGNNVTVIWTNVPAWNWVDSTNILCGSRAVDKDGNDSGWNYASSRIYYENDLQFTGTLSAVGATHGSLTDGQTVTNGENIIFSNLTAVFENTLQNPSDGNDFNLAIRDSFDNLRFQRLGTDLDISIRAFPVRMDAYAPGVAVTAWDGSLTEWTDESLLGTDSDAEVATNATVDWQTAWMSHNDTYLNLAYSNYQAFAVSSPFNVFIDTDTNRASGYRGGGDQFSVGAEYMLQGGFLYTYTGSGTDWSWGGATWQSSATGNKVQESSIARTDLGSPTGFVDMIFFGDNTGDDDYMPDTAGDGSGGRFFRYNLAPCTLSAEVTYSLIITNITPNGQYRSSQQISLHIGEDQAVSSGTVFLLR